MRIGGLAAILSLAAFVSGYALAQEGYGTVTFTVEVAGSHHVPTGEFDGFRYTKKKRVFRGTARLKYAGQSFAAPSPAGYDKAAFEREKDACEQKFSDEEKIAACQDEVQARQNAAQRAAMQGVNPATAAMSARPIDVWASESCSGELEVADTGTYRRFDKDERRISEVPTSLTAKRSVTPDAQGSDGCAFNLTYDPTAKTALINIDPGPLRVEAIEKTNQSIARTHINPFDWSAIRKFEKGGIKVGGTRTAHSGVWTKSGGEPMALAGVKRAKDEVVETTTKITWEFSGQPAPQQQRTRGKGAELPNRGRVSPPGGVDEDEDLVIGCLKEQEEAGRAQPDPIALMECVQKRSKH